MEVIIYASNRDQNLHYLYNAHNLYAKIAQPFDDNNNNSIFVTPIPERFLRINIHRFKKRRILYISIASRFKKNRIHN